MPLPQNVEGLFLEERASLPQRTHHFVQVLGTRGNFYVGPKGERKTLELTLGENLYCGPGDREASAGPVTSPPEVVEIGTDSWWRLEPSSIAPTGLATSCQR